MSKGSAGALIGAGLGALFALPTGGMSVGMGAAIGGAAGSVAGTTADVIDSNKAMKSAANDANARQSAAIAALKAEQSNASTQAQEAVAARRARMASSKTVYTSPLGISGTADVARKTLLGQ